MTTKRQRERIAPGVYRDQWGLAAIVHVRPHPQEEKRFDPSTPLRDMQRWQSERRTELLGRETHRAEHGTFARDVPRYLKLVKYLISWKSRKAELAAWIQLYGDRPRRRIGRQEVLAARNVWLEAGYTLKTVKNREAALRHFYHTLDGDNAPTPCDEVTPLETHAQPRFVPPAKIRQVAKKITDPKTCARYKILTASGVRPSQLMRAEPSDIDFRRRIWTVRAGKGGKVIPMYLHDDLRAAWKEFIAAKAWGWYDTGRHAKRLYAAGWPQEWRESKIRRFNVLRPYQAKHSVAIAMAERGVEWQDIADHFGQMDVKTTKIYTGVVLKRLKMAQATLTGRLGWQKPASHKKKK